MENEIRTIVRSSEVTSMAQLVELTLGDLIRFEKLAGFKIDMGQWVDVDEHGNACAACLGGCYVLSHADNLDQVTFDEELSLNSFDTLSRTFARILDDVRRGFILTAVETFLRNVKSDDEATAFLHNRRDEIEYSNDYAYAHLGFAYYDDDPSQFKKYLQNLINFLNVKGW